MPLLNAICVSLCVGVIGFCLGVVYTDPSKDDGQKDAREKEHSLSDGE